jgi:lipoprotein-anchoring transpeptidase ErfK/SrfK
MKLRSGLMLGGSAALLLGSASPPAPQAPLLAVDPGIFDIEPGCPGDAGEACILFADGSGEIVIAGLPRPAAQASEIAAPASPGPRMTSRSEAAGLEANGASPVRVVVSLPQQKAYVFRSGALVATAPVSTGRPGHPTPVGTFRILQKKVRHHSNRYSNAPMPFMQRLTNYGIALHAGRLPGYPASHGCIRLPWNFAKKLYGMTDGSTRVTITREKLKIRGGDRQA